MQKQSHRTARLALAVAVAFGPPYRLLAAAAGSRRAPGNSVATPETRKLGQQQPGAALPVRQHLQPERRAQSHRRARGRSTPDEIALLREQVGLQQKQIEQLRVALDEQKNLLERAMKSLRADSAQGADFGQVASLRSVIPLRPAGTLSSAEASAVSPASAPTVAAPAVATQSEIRQYATKVDDLSKKVDGVLTNLGNFKFSGDFRIRSDVQARSGNSIAAPLQNIRTRYRLRLNVDKELDRRFRFHMQLSTGALNNAITADQDFAGTIAKQPFSIAEAYVDFHSKSMLAMRVGRMEEAFADYTRFLWDDDVRFNGSQQTASFPLSSNALGIKSIEFRAGEYILSNPNVTVLSLTSPLVKAGYQPGQKVRDANLFHPGLVVKGGLGKDWGHQFTGDIQIYRNPNQIQLASTADGVPVLVNNALGIALAGPMTGAGNATTTPGGAIYNARHFQIARVAYRLEHSGWKLRDREMPAWLDFQVSRNTGTSKLRDALMVTANVGAVKGFGDVRFLYQFSIKDANSLVSQFTDDDLGTGTGVNISTHAMRFDLGLGRFLQWQNLFFIQGERRPSNSAGHFFVPLQRGANTTFRYLGQFTFTF